MLATDATGPRGALVLVADDDRSFLELVSHWLRDAGCEVLTAESGHETIRVAEERRPDLVLLDIVLPGLNGFQVCEEFKNRPALANIPIIVITGLRDPHNLRQVMEAGVSDVLMKPLEEELLVAHVRRALLRAKG